MSTMNRMDWLGAAGIAAFAVAGAVACSSSSSPASTSSDAATSDATGSGSTSGGSSGSSSGGAEDTGAPPADGSAEATTTAEGGGGNVTLTVKNYLLWCSVTINGGTASTAATVTASVAPGSMATIVAKPASAAFAIGTNPWFGVTQNDGGAAPGTDVGTGATETTTATVVVTGNQCVSVCCGDAPNGTNCPTTNPCP